MGKASLSFDNDTHVFTLDGMPEVEFGNKKTV
jgi:hypothetical protein